MKPGKLSLVATPIGNLQDMTYRAVRTLSEADYILCEDTRVTGVLLKHYDINGRLRRYDAHATEHTHETILRDLAEGKQIALVSDAGTPGISDPGVYLVQRARAAEVLIEVIPGASALTAAVSLAGLSGNQFIFLGFVPQKKGRATFFTTLPEYQVPIVFFESTHRILKTLESLKQSVPEAKVSIGRELTKLHEELLVGTAEEILDILVATPVKQKGEFVVIVDTRS
jgi:16S rRNA (cytidine1402-2'-O)-methyltransferase